MEDDVSNAMLEHSLHDSSVAAYMNSPESLLPSGIRSDKKADNFEVYSIFRDTAYCSIKTLGG